MKGFLLIVPRGLHPTQEVQSYDFANYLAIHSLVASVVRGRVVYSYTINCLETFYAELITTN